MVEEELDIPTVESVGTPARGDSEVRGKSGGPGPREGPGAPNSGPGRPTERAQGSLSRNTKEEREEKKKKKIKGKRRVKE